MRSCTAVADPHVLQVAEVHVAVGGEHRDVAAPGSAVPGRWPGPTSSVSSLTPSRKAASTPIDGIRMMPRGWPSTGRSAVRSGAVRRDGMGLDASADGMSGRGRVPGRAAARVGDCCASRTPWLESVRRHGPSPPRSRARAASGPRTPAGPAAGSPSHTSEPGRRSSPSRSRPGPTRGWTERASSGGPTPPDHEAADEEQAAYRRDERQRGRGLRQGGGVLGRGRAAIGAGAAGPRPPPPEPPPEPVTVMTPDMPEPPGPPWNWQ